MIAAYQKYKAAGFACLPTGPDKMPAIPKGQTWKGGWSNQDEYKTSFGIGILGGKISGNLECIDFDNHFGDAKQVLQEFSRMEGVAEIVRKYKLPLQSTTSGGYHLLYRCDLIEGNQKLASRPKTDENGKVKADVLIETRGEGGYFVADPTPGYKAIKNDLSIVNIITAEDRMILLSACRSFNKNVRVQNNADEDKDKIGDQFNRSFTAVDEMVSALKDSGWKEIREGIWQRPGKDRGISATLGRAYDGIFYNFSSSADPFDQEKGYTAFQVVGLLKYGGDFKAFARDLHERFKTPEDKKEVQAKKEYKKEEPKTEDQLNEILRKSFIDLEVPIPRPPVILSIKSRYGMDYRFNRVLTLGNFSAIKGKSKSKKTFLTTLILSAVTQRGEFQRAFLAEPPLSKPGVVLFDTEQSPYDAYVTAHRVWDLTGKNLHFGAFNLREYNPLERCSIIERYLSRAADHTSLVVIDGIADLAKAINDEDEASRVVSLLMKWSAVYNIHIVTVIHENKNDSYATGHLGSAILKKAECIISVVKDTEDNLRSEVSCDLIRGTAEFDKFSISIDDNGLPKIEFINSVQELRPEFANF